jgi:hypothetical protein
VPIRRKASQYPSRRGNHVHQDQRGWGNAWSSELISR